MCSRYNPIDEALVGRITTLERPIASYVHEYRTLSLLPPSISTLVRHVSPMVALTTRENYPDG